MLRILHGDVYTNERLYRFGLIDNSRCDRCQEVDTLDHRLNSCQGTEVIRSCLTTLTSKLFKTLQIDQVEAIDQLLVTHKDCSKAILTVHAEILSKIVIGKQEIPRNPRNMLKNIVMQLIKKESGNEAKIDLQQLIPYL